MYIIVPFIAWFICGLIKFLINLIRFGFSEAIKKIGYGNFPSNHTCIVSTSVFLIGYDYGFNSSIFALGLSVLFVIIIDAKGLRREVGRHSVCLNKLFKQTNIEIPEKVRETMGHKYYEILGGLVLGFLVASIFKYFVL